MVFSNRLQYNKDGMATPITPTIHTTATIDSLDDLKSMHTTFSDYRSMNNDILDLVDNEPDPPVQINSLEANFDNADSTPYIDTAASSPFALVQSLVV